MVSFLLTPEQAELSSTARRFFEQRSALPAVRDAMQSETGVDRGTWRQLGEDLGFLGIAVPEMYGGAGSTFVELAIVMEEAGRALACLPILSSAVLASNAVMLSGDEQAMADYLPDLATGERIGTLALAGDCARWGPDCVRLEATEQEGGWQLDGQESYVVDGHVADIVFTVAHTADGDTLFAIDAASEGVQRQPLPTLDQTRRVANITFRHAPARVVGTPGAGWQIAQRALELGAVAMAAEQLGGAQRCLEMTLDYLNLRYQFDRPIGSFQGLKHRCADLLMEIESARSIVMYAARAATEATDDFSAVASMAKAYCSDVYFHAAGESIQMHGGIGFTWEHDAHLFFKRATADRLLLGSPEDHNELMLSRIGV